jgi:hypothetical protein
LGSTDFEKEMEHHERHQDENRESDHAMAEGPQILEVQEVGEDSEEGDVRDDEHQVLLPSAVIQDKRCAGQKGDREMTG